MPATFSQHCITWHSNPGSLPLREVYCLQHAQGVRGKLKPCGDDRTVMLKVIIFLRETDSSDTSVKVLVYRMR